MSACRGGLKTRLADLLVGHEEVLQRIDQVQSSGVRINGPATSKLETAFGAMQDMVQAMVPSANGTMVPSAMYLALNVGPDNEVFVSSLTSISSAAFVLYVSPTAVSADGRPDTFSFDLEEMPERIAASICAIWTVHCGGPSGGLDALRHVAAHARIHLVEGGDQAYGAAMADCQ